MKNHYLQQKIYYFLGIFIGLSSRVKKFLLGLKSPRPRMLPAGNYEKNRDYSRAILAQIAKLSGQSDFFAGKSVLEIGPGPDLLIGLMILEAGARSYQAIDYFPVLSAPRSFYENIKLELSSSLARTAADQAVEALDSGRVPSGPYFGYKVMGVENLAATGVKYDLIFSKDVLEHVGDLPAAFRSLRSSLAPGGIMVHKIDFQTHTSFIQEKDRLNFLRYGEKTYRRLVKFRGGPNRLRLSQILDLATASGFQIKSVFIDKEMEDDELTCSKKYLSKYYRNMADSALKPLSAWIICQ